MTMRWMDFSRRPRFCAGLILILGLVLLAAGCARSLGGRAYDRSDARQAYVVTFGQVASVQPVRIEGEAPLYMRTTFADGAFTKAGAAQPLKKIQVRGRDPIDATACRKIALVDLLIAEGRAEEALEWAQQANELQGLNTVAPERVLTNDSLAVIRFPVSERTHPPYFFTKTDDGWQLDFWTMSQTIQMNHKNMWHFRHLDHEYAFGFADWEFDRNGFPVRSSK